MESKIKISLPEEFNEPMDRGVLCANDLVCFLVGTGEFTCEKSMYDTAIKDLIYKEECIIDYAYIELEDWKWVLVLGIYNKLRGEEN